MTVPKDSWNIIQAVIRRYPENITEYKNEKTRIVESTPQQDGQPRGNFPGNRLEMSVIQMTESPKMLRLTREIEAVNGAYKNLNDMSKNVVELRWWSDRYKNTPYRWIERKSGYSERQMRRICKAFVLEVGRRLGEI